MHSASFSRSPTLTCINIQSNQCVQPIRYRTTGFNRKTGFDRETGFNRETGFSFKTRLSPGKLNYQSKNRFINRKLDYRLINWFFD